MLPWSPLSDRHENSISKSSFELRSRLKREMFEYKPLQRLSESFPCPRKHVLVFSKREDDPWHINQALGNNLKLCKSSSRVQKLVLWFSPWIFFMMWIDFISTYLYTGALITFLSGFIINRIYGRVTDLQLELENIFVLLESELKRSIRTLKHCELVRRGYTITSRLPPIARIELNEASRMGFQRSSLTCIPVRQGILDTMLKSRGAVTNDEVTSPIKDPLISELEEEFQSLVSARVLLFGRLSTVGIEHSKLLDMILNLKHRIKAMNIQQPNSENASNVEAKQVPQQCVLSSLPIRDVEAAIVICKRANSPGNLQQGLKVLEKTLRQLYVEGEAAIRSLRKEQLGTSPALVERIVPVFEAITNVAIEEPVIRSQGHFTEVFVGVSDDSIVQRQDVFAQYDRTTQDIFGELNSVLDCKRRSMPPEKIVTPIPESVIDAQVASSQELVVPLIEACDTTMLNSLSQELQSTLFDRFPLLKTNTSDSDSSFEICDEI